MISTCCFPTSVVFLYKDIFFFWTFSIMFWNYNGEQKGSNECNVSHDHKGCLKFSIIHCQHKLKIVIFTDTIGLIAALLCPITVIWQIHLLQTSKQLQKNIFYRPQARVGHQTNISQYLLPLLFLPFSECLNLFHLLFQYVRYLDVKVANVLDFCSQKQQYSNMNRSNTLQK